jgi:AcrR family transcriptional regulator
MSSGDPETRKKIMEATRRLIEESQGKAVRLQDIAAAAGVSRQAIYLHFGSRTGLMVATVQYVDEVADFTGRAKAACNSEDSRLALRLFVAFWAEYVPTIYGLAKRLYVLRGTDEGAAAAWQDRMDGLRNGPCRFLVERLEADGQLAPSWSQATAIDILWTLLSVQTWESLVVGRGWSQEAYASHLQEVIERVLVREAAL